MPQNLATVSLKTAFFLYLFIYLFIFLLILMMLEYSDSGDLHLCGAT